MRLERHIRQEHTVSFKETFFWSDSRTVLSWIKSDMRNFKPYVACRVSEILEHTHDQQWNWIPTNMNIADVSTRMKVVDTSSTSEWFHGPGFLYQHQSQWPNPEVIPDTNEEKRLKLGEEQNFFIEMLDTTRFSKWSACYEHKLGF